MVPFQYYIAEQENSSTNVLQDTWQKKVENWLGLPKAYR